MHDAACAELPAEAHRLVQRDRLADVREVAEHRNGIHDAEIVDPVQTRAERDREVAPERPAIARDRNS